MIKGINFDPTINYGHVMQVGAMIGAVFLIYMNVIRQQDNHELRIVAIEKAQETDRETLGRIASNIDAIRQDMTIVKFRMDFQPGKQQPELQ